MRRTTIALILGLLIVGCGRPTVEQTFSEIGSGLGESSGPCRKDIVYKVSGTASGVDITMTNASGNTEQASGRAVPLRSASGEGLFIGPVDCGEFVYISAQNTGESGSVYCSIEADGVIFESASSEGAYVIATCSGSVPD